MDNPYHRAEVKPHYLDPESARFQCFDAFNASAGLAFASAFEAGEEDQEASSLFKLHHQLAEPRLSQLLLSLAVFVRTMNDVYRESPFADAYRAHAAATDGRDFIGDLDGETLSLREACNKIIHATDFRPVYDHADRDSGDGEERLWYMTGEIEIEGNVRDRAWNATLYVPHFLEIVLDRIAFTSELIT